MSDDEGGNSRSERLRQRRSQRSERAESAKQSEASKSSKPSEPSKPSKQDDGTGSSTVKEEQVGTYMYIPESQKKELERLYNVLKAEFEYEYDREFEKNRHFYPLLVQYGLDGLDGLDASDIRERLELL